MPERRRSQADLVAAGSVVLALGWLAAAIWAPQALAPLVALAVVATCALALLRRPRSRLYLAMGVIAFWLCAGLAGAVLFQGDSSTGLAWILLALFVTPLPLVPWLYATTFESADSGTAPNEPAKAEERGPCTEDRGPVHPGPGGKASRAGRSHDPSQHGPWALAGVTREPDSSLSALSSPLSPVPQAPDPRPLTPSLSSLSPLSSPFSPVLQSPDPRPLTPSLSSLSALSSPLSPVPQA
ncbi:MAG: hypothetical protein AB1625_02650, partial [Acidobacteriota bacterium]